MAQIELDGINRIFRLGDSQVHALRDVTLRIAAGEYVAVMGPSGSGKSTLLNLLGLLDRPNAGHYRLEGRDVTTLSADEQAAVRSARIGFVFQSFHLVPRLTAAENVALPLMLAGIPSSERARRVAQALKEFGLEPRAHHRPEELSGGQRQRVAIARALLKDAPILVLDEATSALDSEVEAAIQEQLYALMEGKTVIAIAHRLSTIAVLDRLIVMDGGRVIESGSHEELLQQDGLYAALWRRQSGGFIGVDLEDAEA